MVRRLLALLAAVLLAPVQAAERPPANLAAGQWRVPARSVWAGEVFDLELAWRVRWDMFQNFDGELDWRPEPLVATAFLAPVLEPADDAGMATIVRTSKALAVAPGQVTIAAPRQAMSLRTGSVAAGGVDVAVTTIFDVAGAAAQLSVRPLPAAPKDFAGAVGRFRLDASLDKASVKVGDAVRWRLTMKGSGNWPMLRGLPSRLLAQDFDVLGPAETSETAGTSLFDRESSEILVVVPRRAGRFTLGPVEMAVFDPQTGRYVRVASPAVMLDVAGLPGEGAALRPPAEPSPEQPSPEPLADAALVPKPFSTATRVWLVTVPPLIILLLWLGLAAENAWRSDTGRRLRRAHRRLATALDLIDGSADSKARKAGLREWQRQMAARCALGAAPVAADFNDDAAAAGLWSEVESALYRQGADIAADWSERARAHRQLLSPPPPFQPLAFLAREHLWPRLVPLLLVFMAVPAAAAPMVEPLDWHGHYNRALVLAERGAAPAIKSEAAVEAAAAWVQAPRDPRTRALWSQLGSRASLAPQSEGGIPGSNPADPAGPFWWLSPSEWQYLLAMACGLGLAGAMLMLLARFGHIGRSWWRNGGLLLAMAGSMAVPTSLALSVQDLLAAPGAILIAHDISLYTLPVEDPAETGLALVRAGAIAKTEKKFLGWSGVKLADGRSGWVRTGATVALWETPTAQPAGQQPASSGIDDPS